MNTMTLGTSTFLVGVGAIMRYAVSARAKGWNVPMVGGILMIVGIVGAILTLALFASTRSRRTVLTGTRGTVLEEERQLG